MQTTAWPATFFLQRPAEANGHGEHAGRILREVIIYKGPFPQLQHRFQELFLEEWCQTGQIKNFPALARGAHRRPTSAVENDAKEAGM